MNETIVSVIALAAAVALLLSPNDGYADEADTDGIVEAEKTVDPISPTAAINLR